MKSSYEVGKSHAKALIEGTLMKKEAFVAHGQLLAREGYKSSSARERFIYGWNEIAGEHYSRLAIAEQDRLEAEVIAEAKMTEPVDEDRVLISAKEAERPVADSTDIEPDMAWIAEELAKEPFSLRDLREWSRQNKQHASAEIAVKQVGVRCECGQMCVTEGNSTAINAPQLVWCNGCGAGWQVEEAVFEPRPYATRPLTYIV